MKNVLKTLGLICIITAVIFIMSCGDLPDAGKDSTITVTFDSDGGSTVSSQYFTKDDTKVLTKPANPTKTNVADPGLYKNWPTTGYIFDDWLDSSGAPFSGWNAIPTASITLKAKWTLPANAQVDLGAVTGNDIVTPAFTKINSETPTANDKYILYIDSEIKPAAALTLTKANTNLTILGKDTKTSIVSPDLSGTKAVFITIGTGDNPTTTITTVPTPNKTTNVTLILENVAVLGSGKETANSLIRVINGATLTLNKQAYISGHISSSGATATTGTGSSDGGGDTGNGAAICVINGSTLNIHQGAIVELNESRPPAAQSNTNRVGGIYVHGNPQADDKTAEANWNKSTVNIDGGTIEKNKCSNGNTGDIYITELVNLNMEGNVKIGELCLNSDDGRYPTFVISRKVTNVIDHLNLRSTGVSTDDEATLLSKVKTAWTANNAKVFIGTSGADAYTISSADVDCFKLWEFTARKSLRGANADAKNPETWVNLIKGKEGAYEVNYDGYEIELVAGTPNYGKLVKVTTSAQ